MSLDDELARRRRHVAPSLSLSYATPLAIDRGEGAILYDTVGRRYLDLVNNVCHVGHCHPRVVAATVAQLGRLNTNTRYVYPGLTWRRPEWIRSSTPCRGRDAHGTRLPQRGSACCGGFFLAWPLHSVDP